MARLDARRWPAFLASPGACRVLLLFGEDAGLVRERSDALIMAFTGGDPMRLAETPREAARDPRCLANEVATLGLMGGARIVRVRDAADSFAAATSAALSGEGPGLVILEGGDLSEKSRLRLLVEAASTGAALACGREFGSELLKTIESTLVEIGGCADSEARMALASADLDRATMRREIERLSLLLGPDGQIGLQDVGGMLGIEGRAGLDEAILAALAGGSAVADRALQTAVADGTSAVQVVRAMLRLVQQLQPVAMSVASGMAAGRALDRLFPSPARAQREGLEMAVQRWSAAQLAALGETLLEAERALKTTGFPDAAVAGQTMALLSSAKPD